MSWSRIPDIRLATALKIRERTRRCQGSRRFTFQPETTSKPSSSFASRRGISAGSSWRSPSSVTTVSPSACAKPAISAAALPKLRRSRTTRTSGFRACSRVSAENVPSVEPSSTKIASQPRSRGSSVDRIAAGRPAERRLEPGEAMAIATGGVVPVGADAVIPIEQVVEFDNNVEIAQGPEAGENLRPRGGDVQAGEEIVSAGARLGPAQIGALAAAGVGTVKCARRPRAAVLSTGTELRAPGEILGPGEVYEANGVMLAAQLESAGALAERLPPVEDDEETHRAALERGLEADLLVTTGGVSVGPHDLVRKIEAELGVE